MEPTESTPKEPLRAYEGSGETLGQALNDAAVKAVDDDGARNLGRQFVVTRHLVTIDNPRVTEHIIEIVG